MSARMSGQRVSSVASEIAAPDPVASRRETNGLLARLACPACHSTSALEVDGRPELRCPDCENVYPIVVCGVEWIPWLFRRPEIAHVEWSTRLRGFIHRNTVEHNRLNRALDRSLASRPARRRIESTMQAHREHREQVTSLLAPLSLDADVLVPGVTKTLHDKLPNSQALTSYAANVFRDWAWNNGENEALLDVIDELLGFDSRDRLGSVLTLGAGACRLSYDLHQKYAPELSVALDFNPLLLLTGCRVIGGEVVPLYEFPQAGVGNDASGVLQHCRAPEALSDCAGSGFNFVLGDATNPPFRAQSFDTIVTPWLIDVIAQDLNDFVPQINRLLPEGGVWINSGPLAFHHGDPRRCYGEEEVVEIVNQCGFRIDRLDRRRVPYLQSPHSAHGRVEHVVSFVARKDRDVDPRPTRSALPDWLLDATLPVPSSPERVVESSSYLLTAQILAAIDGKRSIEAIAMMVAREYNLSLEECVLAVTRVLVDGYENDNSSQLFL